MTEKETAAPPGLAGRTALPKYFETIKAGNPTEYPRGISTSEGDTRHYKGLSKASRQALPGKPNNYFKQILKFFISLQAFASFARNPPRRGQGKKPGGKAREKGLP